MTVRGTVRAATIPPPQPISATKKISHRKPEIFSGFLRFSPFFSLFENDKTVKIKRYHHCSEGFELKFKRSSKILAALKPQFRMTLL